MARPVDRAADRGRPLAHGLEPVARPVGRRPVVGGEATPVVGDADEEAAALDPDLQGGPTGPRVLAYVRQRFLDDPEGLGLGLGDGTGEAFGCVLTEAYVRENSEYTT